MQHDVRGVLFHIFVVELRYGERLLEQPETAERGAAEGTVDELFAIGATARKKFREFMARATEADWNKTISFKTLSVGQMSATQEKVLRARAAARDASLGATGDGAAAAGQPRRSGITISCSARRWNRCRRCC